MTANEQKKAFAEYWAEQKGSEKGEDQTFWNSLLGEVLGVSDVKSRIKDQETVCVNDGSTILLALNSIRKIHKKGTHYVRPATI